MFKTFRPTFLTAEPPELNSGEPNPVEPGSSAVIDLTLSDGELSDIGIVSEDDSASDLSTDVSDSDEEVSEVDNDHIDEMPPGPLILPPVNNLDAVPATVLPTQVQAVDQPAADQSTDDSNDSYDSNDSDSSVLDSVFDW
jgi:hypothetical protein